MKELKYRTLDQLLAEAVVDMPKWNREGFIEPASLIKVVSLVNYNLGLKIHSTKNQVLEVAKYKAKLPDDFHILNQALLCFKVEVEEPVITGTQTEEILCPRELDDPCRCSVTCNKGTDNITYIKQTFKSVTRVYSDFGALAIKPDMSLVDPNCPNITYDSLNKATIKHGYLHTNFEDGTVYINYEGLLEDNDGNLLTLDHPMINEYYEYAVKKKILENAFINGENTERELALVLPEFRTARNNALSVVNTPDFAELYSVVKMNRRAMYRRYYAPFL